jgi:hypothetical protein
MRRPQDVIEFDADAIRAERQAGMCLLMRVHDDNRRAANDRLDWDQRAIQELERIWALPSGENECQSN